MNSFVYFSALDFAHSGENVTFFKKASTPVRDAKIRCSHSKLLHFLSTLST